MMIIAATVICWVVAIARIVISIRGPMLLWRWSFTLTIVSTAIGISATAFDTTIDRLTTPNLAVVFVEEAFVISVGCTFIYLLTLLHEKAPPVGLWVIVVGLTTIESAILVCWLIAPVHSIELKSVYIYGAHMPSIQAFAVLFFATVMGELMASAVFTFRLTRTIDAGDPTGKVGGWLIAGSTAVGASVFLLATCLVFIRPDRSETALLSGVLRNVCALVLIGVMSGAAVMVGGPRLMRFRSRRRYSARLRPLWTGLTELFPVIILNSRPNAIQSLISGDNGLERMLIEIHDGLDLLLVKDGVQSPKDIADEIVSAVLKEQHDVRISSSKVLPPMATEEEERDVLCSLSDHYKQRRAKALKFADNLSKRQFQK